jgi:hypothetical protein
MGRVLAILIGVALLVGLALWVVRRSSRGRQGVIIASEDELDDVSPGVGTYHNCEIHEWVRYKGERYDFTFVAQPPYKLRLKRNELYLPPGLVYTRATA